MFMLHSRFSRYPAIILQNAEVGVTTFARYAMAQPILAPESQMPAFFIQRVSPGVLTLTKSVLGLESFFA
jgi:hypothetical protein